MADIKKYADLILYFGYCNEGKTTEGRYSPADKDKRYLLAIQTILEALDSEERLHKLNLRNIQISAYCGIVKNEKEAKIIIELAEKHISGAEGIIIPLDSMHGLLRFFRKIRFNGWDAGRKDELTDKISGLFVQLNHSAPSLDDFLEFF